MFKRIFVFIFVFVNFQLCSLASVPALDFNGYVADHAGVLSLNAEQIINKKLDFLREKTGAVVAVITLHSLNGDSVENVALEVGRKYRVGEVGKNNGLIFLVAPNEKRLRLEVGYGLEGVISDSVAGRIRDEYILPSFKQGNYETGIKDGVSVISNVIISKYEGKPSALGKTTKKYDYFSILLFLLILFLVFCPNVLKGGGTFGTKRYGGPVLSKIFDILGLLLFFFGNNSRRRYYSCRSNFDGSFSRSRLHRFGGGGGFGGGGASGRW